MQVLTINLFDNGQPLHAALLLITIKQLIIFIKQIFLDNCLQMGILVNSRIIENFLDRGKLTFPQSFVYNNTFRNKLL
jgi:hypothetical protein